jgi:hypothetical protein
MGPKFSCTDQPMIHIRFVGIVELYPCWRRGELGCTCGEGILLTSSNSFVLMTLVRMVSVTREPTSIAPANSITEAMHMACLRDNERLATDVANELATSLARVYDQ